MEIRALFCKDKKEYQGYREHHRAQLRQPTSLNSILDNYRYSGIISPNRRPFRQKISLSQVKLSAARVHEQVNKDLRIISTPSPPKIQTPNSPQFGSPQKQKQKLPIIKYKTTEKNLPRLSPKVRTPSPQFSRVKRRRISLSRTAERIYTTRSKSNI